MFKKTLAILASLAVVGVGTSYAQSAGQQKKRTEVRSRAEVRSQYRVRFVDENGDGINDLFRDLDGDGVPNCQDPDYVPPKDGTGYRSGNGGNGPRGSFGNRAGVSGGGRGLDRGAFRGTRQGLGGGVCDGTGPKGLSRRGRGR